MSKICDFKNQEILLKELVKVIENELDKEAQYNRIKEYYGSNLSTGILISIDQVKESDNEQSNDIIERIYDKPQIRLQDFLSDINIILKDSTLFCTCIYIINQGMSYRHQYQVFLQSSKVIFHMGFIHPRWYESIPTEITNYIIVAQENKDYTTKALCYIDQIWSANVYTSNIKEKVSKKIEFGSTISVAKTSIQVAVAEGVASELIRLLTQFITKYHHNTGLNIKEVHSISHFNDEIQESSYNYQQQPLVVVKECNILKISNPEYHKPKVDIVDLIGVEFKVQFNGINYNEFHRKTVPKLDTRSQREMGNSFEVGYWIPKENSSDLNTGSQEIRISSEVDTKSNRNWH
ncbi:hypothetical protein C1646_763158 [Rhizophagus diaphanus]|nr:hypothetical protein C1646_763158 [Rhizophagus diaphanus] [Rhizophagus sp. MUCL 43196]